jgi:hypothetical protein
VEEALHSGVLQQEIKGDVPGRRLAAGSFASAPGRWGFRRRALEPLLEVSSQEFHCAWQKLRDDALH